MASAAAVALLAWILIFRKAVTGGWDVKFLPAVNASLNSLSAIFIVAAIVAIKKGKERLHKFLMTSAFATSAVFLVCYLIYHYAHGDTKYTGEGVIRITLRHPD